MSDEPLKCSHCGCELYLFPAGIGWERARREYLRCGWSIPRPVCGSCIVAAVRDGSITRLPADDGNYRDDYAYVKSTPPR